MVQDQQQSELPLHYEQAGLLGSALGTGSERRAYVSIYNPIRVRHSLHPQSWSKRRAKQTSFVMMHMCVSLCCCRQRYIMYLVRRRYICKAYSSECETLDYRFVFDCPAYSSIRDRFSAIFWGLAPTLSCFFRLQDSRLVAKFLHECFAHRSSLLDII